MRAAVLHGSSQPLVVEEVEPVALAPHQLRVQVDACGVCHSDIHTINIDPYPLPLPMIMGHEGAGTVVEVGADVTSVAPGDRVIAALFPSCGMCFHCVRGESNLCDRLMDV